jgi:iron(III) transport system permease protein
MKTKAAIVCVAFAVVAWAPAVPLALDAAALSGAELRAAAWKVAARWEVLAATIALAALPAIGAALAGGLAALACHGRKERWTGFVIAVCAAVAVAPPYLHALAWMPVLSAGGGRIHGMGAWVASGWVMALAAAPVSFVLAAVQLRAVQPVLISAAALWVDGGTVVRRIALPLLRPAMLAAGALVYLSVLSDYAAPSLFSADPWALAVFSEYSATYNSGLATVHSLPVMLAAIPAAVLLAGWIRGLEPRHRSTAEQAVLPVRITGLTAAGLAVMAVSAGWLVSSLAWQAAQGVQSLGAVRAAETVQSLAFAAVGALMATAAGAPLGQLMASRPGIGLWLFAVLPLAMPAPLTGIGLIRVWNQPWSDWAYGTPLMISIAAAARFAPLAALLAAGYRRSLDGRSLEVATLYAGPWRAFLRVHLRVYAPGWAGAALLAFALSLGEVAATLPVSPPGATTAAIRLYNYLHYGAAGQVAALALALGAVSAAAGWGLAALLGRRGAA